MCGIEINGSLFWMKGSSSPFLSLLTGKSNDSENGIYTCSERWNTAVQSNLIFTDIACRSFHKGDIVSSSRVIVGVDASIADAASLALMVESVGQGTDQWKDAIKRYACMRMY